MFIMFLIILNTSKDIRQNLTGASKKRAEVRLRSKLKNRTKNLLQVETSVRFPLIQYSSKSEVHHSNGSVSSGLIHSVLLRSVTSAAPQEKRYRKIWAFPEFTERSTLNGL